MDLVQNLMADFNDFFIRSLRKSTCERVGTSSKLSNQLLPLTHPRSRPSAGGNISASPLMRIGGSAGKKESLNQNRHSMPPDLLANLLPQHQNDHALNQTTKNSGDLSSMKKPNESDASKDGRFTVFTSPKKLWASFTAKNVVTTPCVVKEYQTPIKLIQDKPISRRNSAAGSALESQVRVVPAWFPPPNIPKLTRQGSFHGETAASRLLRAKQRAMEPVNGGGRRGSSGGKGSESDVSGTPTIPEEPDGLDLVSVPKKSSKGIQRPNLTIDTRSDLSSPTLCPRHLKHHSAGIPPAILKSKSSVSARSPAPPSPSLKRKISVENYCVRQRSAFKFGTLPRSFRVSSSHSPVHNKSSLQNLFKPISSSDLREPKSAPIVPLKSPHGKSKAGMNSYRGSWHVTTPAERPDIAVPSDQKAWLDPLAAPVVPQKLCTCGDTRKHVHLVKFSEDLTVTNTRYFVDGDTDADRGLSETFSGPRSPFSSSPTSDESEAEAEADLATEEASSLAMPQISAIKSPLDVDLLESELQKLNQNLSSPVAVFKDDVVEVISDTFTAVQREINLITSDDKIMLKKLVDMSDQIRQWNGGRMHRIRSVDSSPITSRNDLFALDVISSSLGKHSGNITNKDRRNKTLSMDNITMACCQEKGQPTVYKPTFALQLLCDPDISAIPFRSSVHLSYSNLLKNSSKFWKSSQSGSNDENSAAGERASACMLREASLSLVL